MNLEFPEWVWKFHEDAFRKGALSGQRKIAAAIDQLTRGGKYGLVGEFKTPLGYPIKVWARRRAGEPEVGEKWSLRSMRSNLTERLPGNETF